MKRKQLLRRLLVPSIGVQVAGRGGDGPLPEILFRDDFLTDEAAPLTSPRAAEPGPGEWNVVDVAGKIIIANGEIVNTGALQSSLIGTNALGRVNGRAAVISASRYAAQDASIFGEVYAGFLEASAWVARSTRAGVSGSWGSVTSVFTTSISSGIEYLYAVVARSSGEFYLRKRPGEEWELGWVSVGTSGTLRPYILRAASTPEPFDARIQTYRCADLFGPWLDDFGIATDRIAGSASASATFAHKANCLVEWTQTTRPSADYTDIYVRHVDDDNTLVVSVASDGTMELFEISSGNWSSLGTSSAGAVTNGNRCVVICVDDTVWVYSNNTRRITATSSLNQSATSGKLAALGTSGAVSDIVSWPRTLSGKAKQQLDAVVAYT